jgi:hypothetical protein
MIRIEVIPVDTKWQESSIEKNISDNLLVYVLIERDTDFIFIRLN